MAGQGFRFFLSLTQLFFRLPWIFQTPSDDCSAGPSKGMEKCQRREGRHFRWNFLSGSAQLLVLVCLWSPEEKHIRQGNISSTVIFPAGVKFKMCWGQSQKKKLIASTMLTGKFLRIQNVFAAGLMVSSILIYYLDDPENIQMVSGATRSVYVLQSVQIVPGWSEKCPNDLKSVTMNLKVSEWYEQHLNYLKRVSMVC